MSLIVFKCYISSIKYNTDSIITVRKRIRIPCGILIQDGDRSVTLQANIAYFFSKSAFKLKNYVPMNKI